NGTIMDIQTRGNNSILVLIASRDKKGTTIAKSDDLGMTWEFSDSNVGSDSWSFAIDKCDTNSYFVASEKIYVHEDSISSFFLSRNQGKSWKKTTSKHINYLCGSVCSLSNKILFLQTMN